LARTVVASAVGGGILAAFGPQSLEPIAVSTSPCPQRLPAFPLTLESRRPHHSMERMVPAAHVRLNMLRAGFRGFEIWIEERTWLLRRRSPDDR